MKIQTKPATPEYRQGWDRTFGTKVYRKPLADPDKCEHLHKGTDYYIKGKKRFHFCLDCGTVLP